MQNNWRILVIEDDPDGQEVVSTILDHLNIPMDVASDAEEAEVWLFDEGVMYDAIILDLALPGKDGWTLLNEILSDEATANIPCVAITAYHSSKTREEALKAGFASYFPKPIDATTFARHLESLLQG